MLPTSRPSEAETLKWPVIADFKKRIDEARKGQVGGNRLLRSALAWKEAIAQADTSAPDDDEESDAERLDFVLGVEAEHIAEREGEATAVRFLDIVRGRATPFESFEADWLARYPNARTHEARILALKRLREWCGATDVAQTVEAITAKVAGRFVTERYERQGVNPATANKDIGALASFWRFLEEKGHAEVTPWRGKRIRRSVGRTAGDNDPSKRPFTDAEVSLLLANPKQDALGDMMRIAALTGMRIAEIAGLRVKHVQGGFVVVASGKTKAAKRSFPLHTRLAELMERRTKAKRNDEFVIEELPEQPKGRRSRAAPVTQAFTRWRRKAGVDERQAGVRQSGVDFHSWRRWFIRKAADATLAGQAGFSPWTIADVVGHSKDELPLAMTMGVYPGKASEAALRACVEAVRLPTQKQTA